MDENDFILKLQQAIPLKSSEFEEYIGHYVVNFSTICKVLDVNKEKKVVLLQNVNDTMLLIQNIESLVLIIKDDEKVPFINHITVSELGVNPYNYRPSFYMRELIRSVSLKKRFRRMYED